MLRALENVAFRSENSFSVMNFCTILESDASMIRHQIGLNNEIVVSIICTVQSQRNKDLLRIYSFADSNLSYGSVREINVLCCSIAFCIQLGIMGLVCQVPNPSRVPRDNFGVIGNFTSITFDGVNIFVKRNI
jgi:hypothetical protein